MYLPEEKVYITAKGHVFKKGEYVLIGMGSDQGGKYQYISTRSVAVGAIPLNGGWKGSKFQIKDILVSGNKKNGYIPILKLGGGNLANYFSTIDAAIESGEILLPEDSTWKPVPAEMTSVADEIRKLKALLDEGVITQLEFETQKKKLLNKQ
ncbi:SHOCT domain-containing protein [Chitinophaga sp. MAH-28]|uniref:SHOCT domain-containing protein n=2 Tax=Chitinophagaceae TaxID=563835 RepID=A0ABS3YCT3_9BACT|nr:SHOCT domain-containing protein [Chitinophaga chungangae]